MIALDTNVLSEAMRPAPDSRVIAWIGGQDASKLFLSSVTVARLRHGALLLPEERRRRDLETAIETVVGVVFADRVLPFDARAAVAYAEIVVARERAGRPMSQGDAQIAAIALVRGASVATRNVRDFDGTGVGLIDPWTA